MLRKINASGGKAATTQLVLRFGMQTVTILCNFSFAIF